MSGGGLLALDLARNIGWTLGPPGSRTAGGVWVLPDTSDHGRQMSAFVDVLCDAFATFNPDALLIEAALPSRAQKSEAAAVQNMGLASHAQSCAYRYDLRVYRAHVQTIRSEVFGTSRVPGNNDKEKKAWIVRWCNEHGFPAITNHNEADSAVLWTYGCRFHQKFGRWA
jgi:hypothetical protein